MTPEAVLLTACAMLGIRDPAEFYALPDAVQGLWLEHAVNTVSGAYGRKRARKVDADAAKQAADAERAFLAAKRGVTDGPR